MLQSMNKDLITIITKYIVFRSQMENSNMRENNFQYNPEKKFIFFSFKLIFSKIKVSLEIE